MLNVSQQLAHIIERQYEPRSLFMLSFAPQWSLQTAWCVYEKSLFLFSYQFFLFLVFRPVERKHPKNTFRCLILVHFSVRAYFICIIQHKKWNIHIYIYVYIIYRNNCVGEFFGDGNVWFWPCSPKFWLMFSEPELSAPSAPTHQTFHFCSCLCSEGFVYRRLCLYIIHSPSYWTFLS